DEEQGRLMRADQLEQARVDRRPDGGAWRLAGRSARYVGERRWLGWGTRLRAGSPRRPRLSSRCAEPRHVLDRHFDPEFQLLLFRGIDDRDWPEHRRWARWRR